MKRTIILLFFICFPLRSFSEELKIEDCLEIAMRNNSEVIKAEKGLDAAKSKIWQAKTYFLPTFSMNGLYTHLNEEPPEINFQSFLSANPPQILGNPLLQYAHQDNYSASFKINQPLFTGGKILQTLKSYESEYNIRQAELDIAKSKLKVEIVKAFYGVILAKEMKKLAEEATSSIQKHLDRVKEFMKNGVATEYDFLRTESQLLSWQPRLAKTDREIKNAEKGLNFLIGIEPDSNISISGELDSNTVDDSANLEDLEVTALENRPEITIADESRKINESLKKMRTSSYLPQVNFQYNYNFLDKESGFELGSDSWNKWWDMKIMLSWEFFTFGRHYTEVKEADLKKQQSEIDINSLKNRIKIEIENAIDYKNETRASVSAYKKSVEAADKSYAIANERYKNGTLTNIDVLDSYISLTDAKVQLLKAIYDYKVADAELERIAGLHR